MNRSDLQKLSKTRIREAKLLFASGEYSGAYYLAGYAVECALKACFAKGVQKYDFPDKSRATKVFVHKIPELVALARLGNDLKQAQDTISKFDAGWEIVCRWTEESRYSIWTKDDAEALIDAIIRKDGVMPWIKQLW